jgi:hypothetical protein
MNLALVYLWKEWRAQRGILIAYTLLILASLCIGLSIAPTHYWLEEDFGVHALTWFVTAGVIGVVAFVAPGLVRSEFTAKDDLFVRRLPGALRPAVAGKLLFLLLAGLLLPLLCLWVGESFVTWRDGNWDRLFRWNWAGEVTLHWPQLVVGGGLALLLAPWVWAIGTWLPKGRMALGGALLFVLVVALLVAAVLRQSPRIEEGIAWQGWLWLVAPLGLLVAGVSFGVGRRGGGPLRSARLGLCVTGLGLLPPGAWFAERAWSYHHPDPQQFASLQVMGMSPDGRYALASGNAMANWSHLPFRIDLQTGAAEQIGGLYHSLSPGLVRPYAMMPSCTQRYWHRWDHQDTRTVFDLATGVDTPIGFARDTKSPELSGPLGDAVAAEVRRTTPFRLPGNRPVWAADGWLVTDDAAGGIRRVLEVPRPGSVRAAGHGVVLSGPSHQDLVDLATGETLAKQTSWGFLVRDVLLLRGAGTRNTAWQEQRAGARQPVEALRGAKVLGLLDDDRVLVVREWAARHGAPARLFTYRPADGAVVDFAVPAGLPFGSVEVETPLAQYDALLPRDPGGKVWLRCSDNGAEAFARFDPATGELVVVPATHLPRAQRWFYRLLAWPAADRAVLQAGTRIVQVDLASGGTEVLFPRADRSKAP